MSLDHATPALFRPSSLADTPLALLLAPMTLSPVFLGAYFLYFLGTPLWPGYALVNGVPPRGPDHAVSNFNLKKKLHY